MNRAFLFTALLYVGMTSGCASDNPPVEVVDDLSDITADVTRIDAPFEGGTYTVNLDITGDTHEWSTMVATNDWLTLTPGEDDTANQLTITVAPNQELSDRSEEICVYTRTRHLTITVNQGPEERSCELSEREINFAADDFVYHNVSAYAYENMTIDTTDASWLQFAGLADGTIEKGSTVTFDIAPVGPNASPRSAVVAFTGQETGTVTRLVVNQQPVDAVNAFPVRWNYDTEDANNGQWLTKYTSLGHMEDGSRQAYITAVGVHNKQLKHAVAKSSVAVAGLYTDDYLLFSIPSANLAAGTGVDFMLSISSANNAAPKYWICEILDGGEWRAPKESDLTTNEDGEKYSFYTKYFSSYQYAYFTQSFVLSNPVEDGMVRVRCRVVGTRNGSDGTLSANNTAEIFLPSHYCSVAAYPGIALRDVKKVGILGNSFTQYCATSFLLKEIARSQGHELDIRIHAKGSQLFSNHIKLERSLVVINDTDYDYVVLQEQSTTYSTYADAPTESVLNDCKTLTSMFRAGSPNAKIILENTWPFPNKTWFGYGSADNFENKLLQGTLSVAGADPNVDWVSPIGVAFNTAYAEGITDLWYSDSKHPSRNGAYLKSCVNYLTIFGERFDANVSNGGCDPTVAARLRDVAERTVLGHEADYYIAR